MLLAVGTVITAFGVFRHNGNNFDIHRGGGCFPSDQRLQLHLRWTGSTPTGLEEAT